MLRLDRLAILIKTQETDVERIARKVEIVRVAAEEGGLELRREDQPDVGVLVALVELVLAALVEADDLQRNVLSSPQTDFSSSAALAP